MQQISCKKFADKDLFGTRSKKDPSVFEWMTYAEFGKEVQQLSLSLNSIILSIFPFPTTLEIYHRLKSVVVFWRAIISDLMTKLL